MMTEYTVMHVLRFHREMPLYQEAQANREWLRRPIVRPVTAFLVEFPPFLSRERRRRRAPRGRAVGVRRLHGATSHRGAGKTAERPLGAPVTGPSAGSAEATARSGSSLFVGDS